MYGLISHVITKPGKRDAFVQVLIEATQAMPGCLSYIVAADAAQVDALWVTEVWEDRESHAQSLTLPDVQETILKARPLISHFANRIETQPIGGVGFSKPSPSGGGWRA